MKGFITGRFEHGRAPRRGTQPAARTRAGPAGLWVLLVFMLGGFAIVPPAAGSDTAPAQENPVPSPALGPEEVVRIQLGALRANDASDHGIAICFRFASPGNRANTGPLERFARMIKDGPYRLMLEYHDARYAEVEIHEDQARQRVTLTGLTGTITYAFYLSRQTHGDCAGCWMTDAVTIEKIDETVGAALTPVEPRDRQDEIGPNTVYLKRGSGISLGAT